MGTHFVFAIIFLLFIFLPIAQCNYNISRELSSALSNLNYNLTITPILTTPFVFNEYTLHINSIYLFDYKITTSLITNNIDLKYTSYISASISISNDLEHNYIINPVEFIYEFSLNNIDIFINDYNKGTLSLNNSYIIDNYTQFTNTQFHNLNFFSDLQTHLNSSLPYAINEYIIHNLNSTLHSSNVLLSEFIDICNIIKTDHTNKVVYFHIDPSLCSWIVKQITIYDISFNTYNTNINSINSIEIFDLNISLHYQMTHTDYGKQNEGCKVHIEKVVLKGKEGFQIGRRKWEFDSVNEIALKEIAFDNYMLQTLEENFLNYEYISN